MGERKPKASVNSGIATFLDVLGWKGVYYRRGDALRLLTNLVKDLEKEAENLRGLPFDAPKVKSISDTIAIFTKCKEDQATAAIEAHGKLCSWLIPRSIQAELPVRGATAFGDYEINENIYVGKAVDEAAAWHEQCDWIGVNLTPSAEYVFEPKQKSKWMSYKIPSKSKRGWEPHCVDWTSEWSDRRKELTAVKDKFRNMGPITPDIAPKFTNTIAFILAKRSDVPATISQKVVDALHARF